MGLRWWWRGRKREQAAEEQAIAEMRRAEDVQPPEPKEVKLSQMRD